MAYNVTLAPVSYTISALVCGVSINPTPGVSRGPEPKSQGYTHLMHAASGRIYHC